MGAFNIYLGSGGCNPVNLMDNIHSASARSNLFAFLLGMTAWLSRKKYPFDEMKVGDSFFVEAKEDELLLVRQRLGSAAYQWRLNNDKAKRFSARSESNGVRLYRVK